MDRSEWEGIPSEDGLSLSGGLAKDLGPTGGEEPLLLQGTFRAVTIMSSELTCPNVYIAFRWMLQFAVALQWYER